ncbi:hypothetical protein K7X08_011323 [Anisodus acutangulus]|uniref:Uncharacterized protein n=1 Tax=Anisodus acutangulus TaxID=402998 RepID=A0A9Q1LYI6_9SOLA|nr:hypothetical protein K7X08_011323 [Anisodus acutangulus]
MRNKGKVHPSPSSTTATNCDSLSVLNLLPAAIIAIASVLSLEDRQVLAYMLTRSIKPTTFSPSNKTHKSPLFHCQCFDCYTTYWFRWDSSPNRELIHQVIEAFEEHLNTNEHYSNKKNRINKKKDKIVRPSSGLHSFIMQEEKKILPEIKDDFVHVLPEITDLSSENEVEVVAAPLPVTTVLVQGTAAAVNGGHKGLARKVLPDVLGLFNSRLWNLWSPNV